MDMEQMRLENQRYSQLFQKLIRDEERLHEANQKRIKVGMQCLIWIPMIFLALLFLTESEKVIFLILWIISLFAIASYLIYIEYIDFQAQERIRSYNKDEYTSASNLIGGDIEVFEETVTQLLRQIDEKKAENRKKVLRFFDGDREGVHHE